MPQRHAPRKAHPNHLNTSACWLNTVRGFDFYLITQHPANIDIFVRRLVGSPVGIATLKNVMVPRWCPTLTWSHVNNDCEKPNSGANGEVSMPARKKFLTGTSRQLCNNRQAQKFLPCLRARCCRHLPFQCCCISPTAPLERPQRGSLKRSANTAKTEQSSIFSPCSAPHLHTGILARPGQYLADYNLACPACPTPPPLRQIDGSQNSAYTFCLWSHIRTVQVLHQSGHCARCTRLPCAVTS